MIGMFLLQKNKSMVLCYSLFISLFFLGSNQVSSAVFEVYEAFNQLSILQNKLDNQTLNSREIKNIREKALSLRAESLECVSETEPQLESLNRKIKIMEATSPEDDIGIYESLRNAKEERSQINAMFMNCSLSAEESTQVIDVSNKLLNEFTTEFLSKKGINIIQAIATIPEQIKLLPSLLFDDAAIKKTNQETLLVLALLLILGSGFGFLLGGQIKKIQYTEFFKQFNRQLILDLRKVFKPFGRVQAPLIVASLGVVVAISLALSVGISESLIVRLALSPLIASLFHVFINFATGSLSPVGIKDGFLEHDSRSLRQRMKFFTLILIISYIIFGPDWLTSTVASEQPLMMIGIVGVLIVALILVLNAFSKASLIDGQYKILSLIGYSALAISFLAELSGFHNLASFILSGFMITLLASYALWSLLTLSVKTRDWMNTSTNIVGIKIRGFLNITKDLGKSRLGIYQLFIDALSWIGFLVIIFNVWDPTGAVLGTLSSYARDGIPIGGIRIVPTNIIGGIIAFTVLLAITGWIKRWIDKRWLRQIISSDRGARDALVTIVGYTGFTISLLVGLSIAGINITGLAVVAGALSVGIGFGLQSIANNFVSGIILLFERPIKAGDFVTVGDVEGFVKKISIRATEIETLDNQDMLVPNSELISGRVTNWVLHNPYGRLRIRVGVAYGSDINKVKQILEAVSHKNKNVITDGRVSEPKALFMGFGDSALEFELRVRIFDIKKRYDVVSELNFKIDEEFQKNKIIIPFPQRDIHIKDWSPESKEKSK
jgi:small-conductance mechanosensitive channel